MRSHLLYTSLLASAVFSLSGASPALANNAANMPQMPTTDAQAAAQNLTARGVIRPGQTAEIAAGMSGKLTSAPYRAGQYFKKGATLAKFNCTRQEAELSALTRAHQTLKLKYENISELHTLGAAGEFDLNIAQSGMKQAAAERDVIKARLSDCVVYAPFSGYVSTQHVAAYETPAINTPLYSILRAGSLEVSVIAPSAWMRWVKSGTKFEFQVDETGQSFTAKVIRTGAAVDPVSQTIELTARPTGKVGRSLAGMSGIAVFDPPAVKKAEALKSKADQ